MSKRIYNKINTFLQNEDFKMKDFLEELMDLIVNDGINPSDKTIATRYSLVKNFLRNNYPAEFSEEDLKNVRPNSDVIDRIVSKDKIKKENKTDVKFSQIDIDNILELKNSKNIFEKFIYLMFISGRRFAEIKEPKYQIKLNRGKPNQVKMQLAKKNDNHKDTLFIVQLIPDTLSAKNFRSETNKIRLLSEDVSTNDFNKRLNRKIKQLFPSKGWHSHTLRGLSAVYMYEKHNPDGLAKNPYIMNHLNQDSLDSSLSYSNYKLVPHDEV
jgi:hypothetical protein